MGAARFVKRRLNPTGESGALFQLLGTTLIQSANRHAHSLTGVTPLVRSQQFSTRFPGRL